MTKADTIFKENIRKILTEGVFSENARPRYKNGKVANYDSSAPIEVSYKKPFPGEPTGLTNPELMYNLKPSHGHNMAIVNGIGRIGYMKGGGKALCKD